MAQFGQNPVGDGAISSGIKVGQPFYLIKVLGDLVTGNQIDLTINGVAVTATTFTTDTQVTMQLLKANLIAHSKVDDAVYLGVDQAYNTSKVRFSGTYQNELVITAVTITGGASQAEIQVEYIGGIDEVPLMGTQEPDRRLTQRVDVTTATKVYHGYALADSAEGDPVWYLYTVDTATANITKTLFPTTGAAFNYSWTDRATYTYA